MKRDICGLTSSSINTDSCCRSTPLENPERSSCHQGIADSTQENTNISNNYLILDVDKEVTVEDFLELEDEKLPGNLGQNMEMKFDDDQHTSGKDLETSPKASIDRHTSDIINIHLTRHHRSVPTQLH